MATIRDVAKKAGVSMTSVSHVINETRFVAPEMKKRILKAMNDLNYRPNLLAQSLRRKQTLTLGLILPDITNPYFAEIARDVEDACFEHGYSVIICNADQDFATEFRYAEVLAAKQVDGTILVNVGIDPSGSENKGRVAPWSDVASNPSMPFIMLDREIPELSTDSIQADNTLGGCLAGTHLLELGHRNIACIAGPQSIYPSDNRLVGFRSALREAGIELDDSRILRGDFRSESGYRIALSMMEWPIFPTAVFAFNDLMAFGAITAFSEHGLNVPKDVSVIGYDNIDASRYFNPRLTTVTQPHREMGRMAVERLIERIADKALPVRTFHLEPHLVIRNSTAQLQ